MLKSPYPGCPGLSRMVSAQFTVEMCITAYNRKKNHSKPLFWGFMVVQGHRRWYLRKARQQCLLWYAASLCLSATVLALDDPIMVKLRFFRGRSRLWCRRSRGISSPSGAKFVRKKLETLGYHIVKTRSLYLTWAWIGTGSWQTDRQPDGQNYDS